MTFRTCLTPPFGHPTFGGGDRESPNGQEPLEDFQLDRAQTSRGETEGDDCRMRTTTLDEIEKKNNVTCKVYTRETVEAVVGKRLTDEEWRRVRRSVNFKMLSTISATDVDKMRNIAESIGATCNGKTVR